MIGNAGGDMNSGRLLIHGKIPGFHLHQPGYNTRSGTVTATHHANQFGSRLTVSFKITLFAVEADHAPGTGDTHVVHDSFTPNYQYLFHALPIDFIYWLLTGFMFLNYLSVTGLWAFARFLSRHPIASTYYLFKQLVYQYQVKHGQDLVKEAFQQLTDAQSSILVSLEKK